MSPMTINQDPPNIIGIHFAGSAPKNSVSRSGPRGVRASPASRLILTTRAARSGSRSLVRTFNAAFGGRVSAELVLVAPEDGSYRRHVERLRARDMDESLSICRTGWYRPECWQSAPHPCQQERASSADRQRGGSGRVATVIGEVGVHQFHDLHHDPCLGIAARRG